MLINHSSVTQNFRCHVFEGIQSGSSAGQRDALHVATLGAPQGDDALLGEHVQRERVDALLVDDHESLVLVPGHGQDLLLQVDDLVHALVRELSFSLHQLLALFGGFVEETGVHLAASRKMSCKITSFCIFQQFYYSFLEIETDTINFAFRCNCISKFAEICVNYKNCKSFKKLELEKLVIHTYFQRTSK